VAPCGFSVTVSLEEDIQRIIVIKFIYIFI